MASSSEQETLLMTEQDTGRQLTISLPSPDYLRSFSYLSEEDSDFEDLPDFTPIGGPDGPDGTVDLFQVITENNDTPESREIPFSAIHNKPLPFSTIRPNCWIPGVRIVVKVTQAERNQSHIKIFNPNLYTVHITHGEYQWTIRRRFKHFLSLHQHLRLFRMRYKFVPTKRKYNFEGTEGHKDRRQSMHGSRNKVPRFPQKPDIMIRTERELEKRKAHLEDYLQNLLHISVYRNHIETLKFFEVSHMSFVKRLGKKWKEGMIMKCSGGRRISIGCCGCLSKFHIAARWKKRWLLIKDSFVAYIRPRDGVICDVMLMDSQFEVQNGFGKTGAAHGLQITNQTRVLLAKCWTGRKADEWQAAIETAASSPMGKDYTQSNRFDSFAPVRESSYAKWFADGCTYFASVAEALDNAQEEIFITDWWLSPEIYLKRPITEGNKWRLDQILERKANQGVKIFILLYKEMQLAINLQSDYSKHTLVSKCPANIKVIRHPDHGAGGVLLWAHHEKMVVVDQKVAFLGGLDLCYGRWDDGKHRLTDLGCIVYETANQSTPDRPKIKIDGLDKQDNDDVFTDEDTLHLTGIQINVSPPSPMPSRSNSLDSNAESNKSENEDVFHDALAELPANIDGSEQNEDQNRKSGGTHGHDDRLSNSQKQNSTSNEVMKEMMGASSKAEPEENVSEKDVSKTESSKEECACQRLSRPDGDHAYDNDSLEEETEEYDKLMKPCGRAGRDHRRPDSSGESQVVMATVHNENSDNQDNVIIPDSNRNSGPENGINNSKEDVLQGENAIYSLSAKDARNSILKNSKKKNKTNVSFKENSEKVDAKVKLKEEEEEIKGDAKESEQGKDKDKGKEKKPGTKFSFMGKKGDKSSDKKPDVQCVGLKQIDKDGDFDEKKPLRDTIDAPHRIRRSISEQVRSSYCQDDDDGEVNNDHDKTQRRSRWTSGKLRRSLSSPEENNNSDDLEGGNQNSRDRSGQAHRRWKMVLNVQKFHSAVKQQQKQMPIPEPEKKPLGPKISNMIKDKITRHDSHRDSVSEIKDRASLLAPPQLQRTSSELAIEELGLKGSSKVWIGKDYCNFIHKDFVNLEDPFADFIDRKETPRMPWHDIGAVVYGKAARDVARHFIGRWNTAKVEKLKTNKDFPLLLPKSYGPNNIIPSAVKDCCNEVKTQILRSASAWSAGIECTEKSIQEAYLHCIESAKHFIYIENQFFITHVNNRVLVKNEIGDALYKRIIRAHRNNENFRVFVVMPLLPAFEGNIGHDGAFAIKAVTHFNYTSISKGPNSLWQRLRKEVMDPLKYIVFCGLRTHDDLHGKLVTELVYVHSKLMIVDDDTVIIGSANINDRSMMGDRDSELAVLVQDIHKFPVNYKGVQHQAGKFASSLRKSLFREHLGLEKDDPVVDDVMSDDFYKKVLLNTASINTTVFQKVFNCVPTDLVKTFAELRNYTNEKPLAERDPSQAREELKKVRGYLVLLPLYFLEEETSIIPTYGKESFLPNSVWT